MHKKIDESLKSHSSVVAFSDKPVDWSALFGNDNPLKVEVGGGHGIPLFREASENEGVNFVAVTLADEKSENLVREVEERELSNVRAVLHDARKAVPCMFEDGQVEEFFCLYPDFKYAFTQDENLVQALFDKLKQGGSVLLVTEDPGFKDQVMGTLRQVFGGGNVREELIKRGKDEIFEQTGHHVGDAVFYTVFMGERGIHHVITAEKQA
ncbi:MAG: hypothetical protein ABH851_07805 [Methanobacteriota archaeon]